jgi:hypothetical protein
MSSLKSHRVVIASLFLPNTVVLGESHPPSPSPTPDVRSELPLPDVFPSHAKEQGFKLSLPPPRTRTPAPILSIVDDLKDKASMGPLASLRFCSFDCRLVERHGRSDADLNLSSVSHWLACSYSRRGARQPTVRRLDTPHTIGVWRGKN